MESTHQQISSEKGQTLIVAVLAIIVLFLAVLFLFDLQSIIRVKVKTQTAADAAALAGANMQKESLNLIGEINLIKATMSAIDQDTFIGIEMQSYSSDDIRRGNWLDKLLRRVKLPRMTVIGPADMLQTIHKDGSMVQAMILTSKQIISEPSDEGAPLATPVGEDELEVGEVESEEEEGLEVDEIVEEEVEDEPGPDDLEPDEDQPEPPEEGDEEDPEATGYVYKKVKDEE